MSVRIRSKKFVMEFVETIFFLFLSSAPFDVAMPSEFGILM